MTEIAKYQYAFRIRYDECDANGKLQKANYLRHIQEAAIQASSELGYDLERYESMGCAWVARETRLECQQDLNYGDHITITTHIATIQKVRSVRYYEIYRSNSLVAKATTDWVFVNKSTGRPTPITTDMLSAYGKTDYQPELDEIPIPPLPTDVCIVSRQVHWCDVDPAQHVNNAVYLAYAEEAALHVVRLNKLRKPSHHHHRIIYKQPAILHDILDINAWIDTAKQNTLTHYCYIFRKSNGVLLTQVASEYGVSDGEATV